MAAITFKLSNHHTLHKHENFCGPLVSLVFGFQLRFALLLCFGLCLDVICDDVLIYVFHFYILLCLGIVKENRDRFIVWKNASGCWPSTGALVAYSRRGGISEWEGLRQTYKQCLSGRETTAYVISGTFIRQLIETVLGGNAISWNSARPHFRRVILVLPVVDRVPIR